MMNILKKHLVYLMGLEYDMGGRTVGIIKMNTEFGVFRSIIGDVVLGKDNWLEWIIENKHSLVFECIDDMYDGYGPKFTIIENGEVNYEILDKVQDHIMDNVKPFTFSTSK